MSDVQRYYNENAETEWLRLDRDRIEWAVTLRALEEYLPPAPARVLDIGGGPGRYSIELTRRGYDVTLADISEGELAVAREKAAEAGLTLAGVTRADARDLGLFESGSFDAVLMMGPLYHLLELDDRRKAVSEAVRVARRGGIVMAAIITRYAAIRWWAKHAPMQVVSNRAVYEQQIATGQTPNAVGFTDIHLSRPAELAALFAETATEHIASIGCEGVVSMIRDKLNELEGEAWEYWIDLNYRLAKDPDTHGLAEHVLHIARKTG